MGLLDNYMCTHTRIKSSSNSPALSLSSSHVVKSNCESIVVTGTGRIGTKSVACPCGDVIVTLQRCWMMI